MGAAAAGVPGEGSAGAGAAGALGAGRVGVGAFCSGLAEAAGGTVWAAGAWGATGAACCGVGSAGACCGVGSAGPGWLGAAALGVTNATGVAGAAGAPSVTGAGAVGLGRPGAADASATRGVAAVWAGPGTVKAAGATGAAGAAGAAGASGRAGAPRSGCAATGCGVGACGAAGACGALMGLGSVGVVGAAGTAASTSPVTTCCSSPSCRNTEVFASTAGRGFNGGGNREDNEAGRRVASPSPSAFACRGGVIGAALRCKGGGSGGAIGRFFPLSDADALSEIGGGSVGTWIEEPLDGLDSLAVAGSLAEARDAGVLDGECDAAGESFFPVASGWGLGTRASGCALIGCWVSGCSAACADAPFSSAWGVTAPCVVGSSGFCFTGAVS